MNKQTYLILKLELEYRLTRAHNNGTLVTTFDQLSKTEWPRSIVETYEYLKKPAFSDHVGIQKLVRYYAEKFEGNNHPKWDAGTLLWDVMKLNYGVNILAEILMGLLGYEWKEEWNESNPQIVYSSL